MPRKKYQDDRDWIYVPDNYEFDLGVDHKLKVHVQWMINCIYYNRVTTGRDVEDYVPLHSNLLGMVMGKQHLVSKVRKICLDKGLVEVENGGRYRPGVHSIRYRLGPSLRHLNFREERLAGGRFAGRVKKFREHISKVDTNDALAQDLRKWVEKVEVRGHEEILAKLPPAKARLAQHQIDNLRAGIFISFRDDFAGRYYSNITGLVSEIRKNCLYVDGEKLTEIDIVNSQPYFLSQVIRRDNSTGEREDTGREQEDNPYVCPNVLFSFSDDVLSGNLYERLMEVGNFAERGMAKHKFYAEAYSKPFVEMKLLGKLYPDVVKVLRQWKTEDGYKSVAWRMQSLEAEIILERICKRLFEEHPTIACLSCHDSVLVHERDLPEVLKVVGEAFSINPDNPMIEVGGVRQRC